MDGGLKDLEQRAIFEEWSGLRRVSSRSLERAGAVARILELPERSRAVTVLGVVGSKGKGTAAIYASATAAAAGFTVGTVTSPGVTDNIDRIRIDGRILEHGTYRAMLEKIAAVRAELPAPDAESGYLSPSGLYLLGGIDTLLACGCDVLVVEAGIGGRSDELSLLALDAVLLTRVFDEHRDVLGPTVVDIARDKLGVVSETTRAVVSLPQTEEVRREVVARCARVGAEPIWVDSGEPAFAPGYGGRNAAAGVRAGLAVCSMNERTVDSAALARTLATVNYPGRLSEHRYRDAAVVIDSAISRDGLVAALEFATDRFGGLPDKIVVSVPAHKDFAGFVAELHGVGTARYFVRMRGSHLPYPDPGAWPWSWVEDDALPELMGTGSVLVVGTATFTGQVLRTVGADVSTVFTIPG
ncbi:folylpolyglutamate synthase/dihydrofolate synthase family protein [Nocardia bovistercoris]|uniref:Bifunctional folylpolyglutamate synthase/dihydrofolate synthase n=1 Tax=Nocardia bovistercoris TaxID=2785916 RepID=A0A931I837_9NOCA|nr:hypothetical protein [Nocardia bovistercoris]MBH0775487.1 hypothetical protein [Nocardia bovistercoris]